MPAHNGLAVSNSRLVKFIVCRDVPIVICEPPGGVRTGAVAGATGFPIGKFQNECSCQVLGNRSWCPNRFLCRPISFLFGEFQNPDIVLPASTEIRPPRPSRRAEDRQAEIHATLCQPGEPSSRTTKHPRYSDQSVFPALPFFFSVLAGRVPIVFCIFPSVCRRFPSLWFSYFSYHKPDTRAVDLIGVPPGVNFGERVIAGLWQFPAETLCEAGGLAVIEPAKDAMANQAAGAQ